MTSRGWENFINCLEHVFKLIWHNHVRKRSVSILLTHEEEEKWSNRDVLAVLQLLQADVGGHVIICGLVSSSPPHVNHLELYTILVSENYLSVWIRFCTILHLLAIFFDDRINVVCKFSLLQHHVSVSWCNIQSDKEEGEFLKNILVIINLITGAMGLVKFVMSPQ